MHLPARIFGQRQLALHLYVLCVSGAVAVEGTVILLIGMGLQAAI
jgi:hypothetical protein